jgi:hypothetical protein
MDWDREERERAIQEADRLKAKFERDEWQRAQRQKRSATAGVNYEEWLASRPKRTTPMPMQQPQQSAPAVMDKATSDAWNKWMSDYVKEYVHHKFEIYSEAALDGIGEAFSLFRAEERKLVAEEIQKLREEIGQLRAEMTLATGIQRGEIAQLKGKADAA